MPAEFINELDFLSVVFFLNLAITFGWALGACLRDGGVNRVCLLLKPILFSSSVFMAGYTSLIIVPEYNFITNIIVIFLSLAVIFILIKFTKIPLVLGKEKVTPVF